MTFGLACGIVEMMYTGDACYDFDWFKFDDERVTKEDMKSALEERYGGEEEYMLVYICEGDKEKIICNVDEKDIAEHLRIRLKKEQEEKKCKKKEKAEAHLYTIIKVADAGLSQSFTTASANIGF
ncbi:hypothetical protein COCNU_08G000270 [Cocos nucifera]|uniref:Uncharacterized protein n=1 Tax=Cocos nucifera TaxID=13894 RepID=A0A8K0II06_COCNU|nr:hypothetical protein COCNU_08G000270 [Cocos nucifera]